MSKNTSIALGEHFEEFVKYRIQEEQKFYALKEAIQQGIDSGVAKDFDSKEHLEQLKLDRLKNR